MIKSGKVAGAFASIPLSGGVMSNVAKCPYRPLMLEGECLVDESVAMSAPWVLSARLGHTRSGLGSIPMMGVASVLQILEGKLFCMAALCSKLDDTMDVGKWAQSRSSTVLNSESSFVFAEEGDCVVVPPGMAFSVTAMTEVAVVMHVPQLHMEMLRAHVDPQDLDSIRTRLAADLENHEGQTVYGHLSDFGKAWAASSD